MRIILFLVLAFSIGCSSGRSQESDLDIDYMLRGYCYASSSIIDSLAAGGFGESKNKARQIDGNFQYDESNVLKILIDTTQTTLFGERYNGYKLLILNYTDSISGFLASDSRLPLIAEAYVEGQWEPIEYLPSSWCGNSYHMVYLLPNEYWEFSIPKYGGSNKVQIRYKLEISNNHWIYSNPITSMINKQQLSEKQGHDPNGIMDPYLD